MNGAIQITLAGLLLALQPVVMAQEEGPGELAVQAFSTSDPSLLLPNANCATTIKELQLYEQYRLVTAANLQGPPGVLFMLQGPGKNVVLLKCGTSGAHDGCEDEGGGGCEG